MLYTICYISNASEQLLNDDIKDLFSQTIFNNKHYGITGILIYHEGTFVQVIEGEPTILDALFFKIKGDGRHNNITRVLREPISNRLFSNYLSGFSGMSQESEMEQFYLFLKTQRHTHYGKRLFAFLNPFLSNCF